MLHGGRATIVPRRSWLRKSRAERPRCQHVRHTDIRTDCARAPAQVRLPPQTLRRITRKRIANSARQLVASSPGCRRNGGGPQHGVDAAAATERDTVATKIAGGSFSCDKDSRRTTRVEIPRNARHRPEFVTRLKKSSPVRLVINRPNTDANRSFPSNPYSFSERFAVASFYLTGLRCARAIQRFVK